MIGVAFALAIFGSNGEPWNEDSTILDSSKVSLVSDAGERDPRFDVFARHVDAMSLFEKLARLCGRKLIVEPGEAELRVMRPLDAGLENRALSEVGAWMAGSVGLVAEISRKEIRLKADRPGNIEVEDVYRRALSNYRLALLRDFQHAEAPRIRFEIGNIHYVLGEYEEALKEYDSVIQYHANYAELPLVWFRKGHAHRNLADDEAAIQAWLHISEEYERSPLVAPSYLQCVRAYRRLQDHHRADLALRHVVEFLKTLAPATVLEAGELLLDGGDADRAAIAFRRVLAATTSDTHNERALTGLVQAYEGTQEWPRVITAAEQHSRNFSHGPGAAQVNYSLAKAHEALDDPGTAILALHRVRELDPTPDLLFSSDLMEGELWARCGVTSLALPLLFQASQSPDASIAVRALQSHAGHALREGRLTKARQSYERLELYPEHAISARIGQARVALEQRQREHCLKLVTETLPQTDSSAERAELMELAREVLRQAPHLRDRLRMSPASPTEESS